MTKLLQFWEPAHHLRWRRRPIHHTALVDAKGGIDFGVGLLQIGLPRQEALAVDGAGGDEADPFAVPIDHRVAVMRHANALLVEAEADHHAFAFLFTRYIRVPPDEPRLVRFDIRTEPTFGHAQVAPTELARAQSHFVTVQRQACFGAERV